MLKKILFLLISLSLSHKTFAADQPHFTIILNQVRGEECCDAGSVANFRSQLEKLAELNLPAQFALRTDALENPEFVSLAKEYPQFNYGALLEITPELATQADVIYKGKPDQW
ncbi:MAG: hypothetical protein COY80_01975, partial [Candidatus Pacebacteria bacterium CG_4_10_14_0_8_um_filter_42_14]